MGAADLLHCRVGRGAPAPEMVGQAVVVVGKYQDRIRQLTVDPVTAIDAHPVYSKDSFRLGYGSRGPLLQHAPYLGTDGPGELEGGYAVAWFKDGTIRVEHVVATNQDENTTLWLAVQRLSAWFPPSLDARAASAGESSPPHREPLCTDLEEADAAADRQPDTRTLGVDDGGPILPGVPPVPRNLSAKVQLSLYTGSSSYQGAPEGQRDAGAVSGAGSDQEEE